MPHNYKLAPELNDKTNYIDWCKELEVWLELTELEEEKKALAIFSSLTGKAKKAALQLDVKDLKTKDGVKALRLKLDKTFVKDKKVAMYESYEKFEKFKRSKDMSLEDYTIEFAELVYCLEKYEIKLPQVVLAYHYLNSANLTETQSTIVKSTIPEYTYERMVDQVKPVFNDSRRDQEEQAIKVKVEEETEVNETYYTEYKRKERENWRGRGQMRGSLRSRYRENERSRGEKKKDPLDKNGEQLRCNICESIYHFVRDCPD